MDKIDLQNIFLQVKQKSIENTKPRLARALEFIRSIIMKASSEGLYSKVLKFDSAWYADITNQKLLRDLLYQQGIHCNFNPIDPFNKVTEIKVSWEDPVDPYKLKKFKRAEVRYLKKINPSYQTEEEKERERIAEERRRERELEREKKKQLQRERELEEETMESSKGGKSSRRGETNGKTPRQMEYSEFDSEESEYRRYREDRERFGFNKRNVGGDEYSEDPWAGFGDNSQQSSYEYRSVEPIKRVEKIERYDNTYDNYEDGNIIIPRNINEVTSKWITEAFRMNSIIGQDDTVEVGHVEEMEKRKGFEEGVHSWRVELSYHSYGHHSSRNGKIKLPSSVVVMLPENDIDSKNRHNLGLYATSHIVHAEVVPRLDFIVKRQIPHCYFTGANADTKSYVWVLEDCWSEKPGGYVPTLFEGMKVEEGLEAIKFLANFHSHWWNNHQALDTFQDILFNKKIFFQVIYDKFCEQYSRIEEFFTQVFKIKLLPQFLETIEFVKELFWSILDFSEKFLPHSVVHGDFSPDDCYFHSPYEGSLNLVVHDWQQSCVFFVGYDLAVFLSRCLSLNTRKKQQSQFLQIYLDEVINGCDPVRTGNLDMGVLESSVKVGLAIYMVRVIVNIMGSPLEKEEDILVMKKVFSRLQATILANDVLDFLQSIDLDADIHPPVFSDVN